MLRGGGAGVDEGIAGEPGRLEIEKLIALDLRELTSELDWLARLYAEQNQLSANEFRALMFVIIAEAAGVSLTAGELRKKMGLSGAAITYLVERMTDMGHLRRESDPKDRRKVILRYADEGFGIARSFFLQVAERNHRAMAEVSDTDLLAAHRAIGAMLSSMKEFRTSLPPSS